MNHKRGRSKNRRAGCLMCKPNKQHGWKQKSLNGSLGHCGFGNIRKEQGARDEEEAGMTMARLDKLERDRNATLTGEEMQKGYHFCPDWDFMLIGPDSPEKDGCLCGIF